MNDIYIYSGYLLTSVLGQPPEILLVQGLGLLRVKQVGEKPSQKTHARLSARSCCFWVFMLSF